MPGVRCDLCSGDGLAGFRVPVLFSRTDFNACALIRLSFVACVTESCTSVIYPIVVQSASYCKYYYIILMFLQSRRYDAEVIMGGGFLLLQAN